MVGTSRIAGDPADPQYHAFLWQSGRMVDLNERVPELPAGVTLAHAAGINDHGAIVGYACPYTCSAGGDYARRAFLLVPIN